MKNLDDPFSPAFDRIVETSMKRWHSPGCAISVVQNDKTWSKAYGYTHDDAPVGTDTLFYACSTTKAMLAAVWAIYIESDTNQQKPTAERVSFATPLADIIPDDFVLEDPVVTRQVTIEDALSHRTGMGRHELCYGGDGAKTLKEVTRQLRHLPLQFSFRTHYEYCNTMFIAASHALETVSGQTVGSHFQTQLWEPLGMTDTYAGYDSAKQAMDKHGKILAKSHSFTKLAGDPDTESGELLCEGHLSTIDVVSGAGYVLSTIDDYAKWMRGLLNPSKPLDKNLLNQVWRPRISTQRLDDLTQALESVEPYDGYVTNYCLGWIVGSYRGYRTMWHPGGVIGAGSYILVVPDLHVGVSVFANGPNGGGYLRGCIYEILDEVLEIPEAERTGRKRVEEAMAQSSVTAFELSLKRRSKAYPNAPPEPNIPHSLPLEKYAGTYSHPGYGSFTFEVTRSANSHRDVLTCNTQRTFATHWEFEHINAENWLVTRKFQQSPNTADMCARSHVGADGTIEGFDMAMEPNMPDRMLWFAKI